MAYSTNPNLPKAEERLRDKSKSECRYPERQKVFKDQDPRNQTPPDTKKPRFQYQHSLTDGDDQWPFRMPAQ